LRFLFAGLFAVGIGSSIAFAQTSPAPLASTHLSAPLTLEQAEQIALKNHPRVGSAAFTAQAAGQVVRETRSAYFPTAFSNTTGALANTGTALAAGAVTTSSLSNRFASGVNVVQLVTDFGRTRDLTRSARLRFEAENDNLISVRAQVILAVRSGYYGVLASDAVLKVAQAALSSRQVLLRQITALSQSALKSTLDVSFAQVLVSEAQLAVYQAENSGEEARAQLATAMGYQKIDNLTLVDQELPGALNRDMQSLIAEALAQRPDLLEREKNRDAAYQFAQAEKKLSMPTIGLAAVAGVVPVRDHTLPHDNYEAAGLNISIPVFNGGLFSARRTEAFYRAQAADKDVQDFSLQVSRDVQSAWFQANTAYRRLAVTGELVTQTNQALRLAQARYDAGLGGIVELNQAQLSRISAQIDAASAKYDYLNRRTALDYAIGTFR
jgi:outer membrane protein